MNDAFTIDLRELASPSPRTSDPSRLRKHAQRLDRVTAKIEVRWDELPEEERTAYAEFAHTVIEPAEEDEGTVRSLIWRSRAAWNLFVMGLKGEQEAFVEYRVAFRRFIEAVLDAVEHENPEYQKALDEALQEGLSGETSEPMTAEGARERRRRLRDQVLG